VTDTIATDQSERDFTRIEMVVQVL